jgi:hypothetical protein
MILFSFIPWHVSASRAGMWHTTFVYYLSCITSLSLCSDIIDHHSTLFPALVALRRMHFCSKAAFYEHASL